MFACEDTNNVNNTSTCIQQEDFISDLIITPLPSLPLSLCVSQHLRREITRHYLGDFKHAESLRKSSVTIYNTHVLNMPLSLEHNVNNECVCGH